MSDPRVSVITRTFNRPLMLRRAIESIAKQTWGNREVVIVNDGGEDVQSIVDEFSDRVDIIYLNFSASDKPGRCLAATKAIEASTGEWIAYLDDDDVYLPHHLETLMKAASETGAMVLYTDGQEATEEPVGDGTYKVTDVKRGPSEDFSRVGFYIGTYIHLSTWCHHRRVFDQHGGFDPDVPVLEDLELYFRYAHDYVFHHVPVVTTQWHVRTDDTNAITSMRQEFRETLEFLAKKYLHIAVGDMIVMIRDGHANLNGMFHRVNELESRVKYLETRLAEFEGREV